MRVSIVVGNDGQTGGGKRALFALVDFVGGGAVVKRKAALGKEYFAASGAVPVAEVHCVMCTRSVNGQVLFPLRRIIALRTGIGTLVGMQTEMRFYSALQNLTNNQQFLD